jgi:chorismate synthase
MSINAVKAVEIGTGFETTNNSGSVSHDEIVINDGIISRKSNRAGGIEGGMTTGLPIIVRVGMKPIATLMSPIGAIDLSTMENVTSRRERSDFTAVPACAVIGESMLAITIAKAMLNKFGGDSMSEILDNYKNYTSKLHKKLKKNFKK